MTERGVQATPGSDVRNEAEELHAAKRLGRPEEIAETVLWLCSEAPSFIVGSAVMVDGGYTAQ